MAGATQADNDHPRAPPLDALRLVRISGADRASFLQAQLTQDLRPLSDRRGARYAWADAQGRVIVAGEVFAWRDALWLTVPADLAEGVVRRLRLFVLRAKVAVDVPGATLIARQATAAAAFRGRALPDGPMECLATDDWCALRVDAGRLLLALPPSAPAPLAADLPGLPADAASWGLADIRAGFARPGAGSSGGFIPQMLNLDLVDAVSFSKGCYPGQEIVTRTRHLGRVKRRMFRYACATPPVPAVGEPLFSAAGECGTVVSAAATPAGGELLAVVRLEAARGPLFADAGRTRPVEALALPYVIPGAIPEAPPA